MRKLHICVLVAGLLVHPPRLDAQGVFVQAGVGAGVTEVNGESPLQPAGQLSLGVQSNAPLTARLDLRVLGNTNSALLGPGVGLGGAWRLPGLPLVYVLGTAGTVLASEGAWFTTAGVAGGAGFGRGGRMFIELRYDHVTSDMGYVRRGRQVISGLGGVRLGGQPRS